MVAQGSFMTCARTGDNDTAWCRGKLYFTGEIVVTNHNTIRLR